MPQSCVNARPDQVISYEHAPPSLAVSAGQLCTGADSGSCTAGDLARAGDGGDRLRHLRDRPLGPLRDRQPLWRLHPSRREHGHQRHRASACGVSAAVLRQRGRAPGVSEPGPAVHRDWVRPP